MWGLVGVDKQSSTDHRNVMAYLRIWVMPWRFEGARQWSEWGTEHSPSHP